MTIYNINTNLDIQVDYVGEEKTPVIFIDNFACQPEQLVKDAQINTTFNQGKGDKNFYPGALGLVDQAYTRNLYDALKPTIREVYRHPVAYPAWVESTFAMVTKTPGNLNMMQRIPHYDSMGPHQLAILHYLCHSPHQGTAFYRHRETGFETIQKAREQEYWDCINPKLESGEYPSRYCAGSNDDFEKIGEVPRAFNRLAIYPSQILHSSIIDPDALDTDVNKGRLTLRTFVAYA